MEYSAKYSATVQTIFQDHFWSFQVENPLPAYKRKAAEAIMKCRTDLMGGHRIECDNHHPNGCAYNSCKHRACPQCAFIHAQQFMDDKKARLLDCQYYHLVFTLPHELSDLYLYNPKVMGDLLLSCATHTVFKFLSNDDHLGATPGLMASLHTNGRNCSIHPHCHILCTAGGLAPEGWRPLPKPTFFLPEPAVEKMFRCRFLDLLKTMLQNDTLRAPPDKTQQQVLNTIETTYQKHWHLRFIGPFDYGHGVIAYLSRYVKGGPIRNAQLDYYDGQHITFTFTDHHTEERTTLRLSAHEFIRRFLLHVPPLRMRTFRMYGIFHNHCKKKLNRCRKCLGQNPYVPAPSFDWIDFLVSKGLETRTQCSICGAPLRRVKRIPPLARSDHIYQNDSAPSC